MNNIEKLTNQIKNYALEIGFDLVGITSPEEIEEFKYFKNSLDNGYLSGMEYLYKYQDKRKYPKLLFEDTKSIISLGLNYYTDFKQKNLKIAKYALGDDYHIFMKEKINLLLEYIKTLKNNVEGKVYVDTAPILERSLAKRAGLGWIGKNTMLINPKIGSYFYIGELFLNIELKYDNPIKNYCGTCNECIKSCPTNAIVEPFVLNSNLCISYHTIESKDEKIPDNIDIKDNLFGCDICQDVCPWNKKFAKVSKLNQVQARSFFSNLKDIITNLTQEKFSTLFKNSAIKRAKFKGIMRNYKHIQKFNKD
ncbi:MAG: epoxyqueuosine reductase [Candidatus Sericytochromatia bacterium]|nr:MAG: epoxyqueuosine reductase [Candidatus Sericytochromatia bacterium]